jgi:chromosome segregation ATPase
MAETSSLDSVARAVAVAAEETRLRVMGVIMRAISLSETELTAAAESTFAFNEEAKNHVSDLDVLIERMQRHWDSTAQLIEHYSGFGEQAASRMREQVGAAERSLEMTGKIELMVHAIDRISLAVKILTVNGRIESCRLGAAGTAFGAIAAQLGELNTEVRAASATIAELSSGLLSTVPQIAESAQALLRMTDDFNASHQSQVADLRRLCEENQQWVLTSAAESKKRAQFILGATSEMLQRLQYQDRMSQDLRDIELIMKESEQLLDGLIQRLSPGGREPAEVAEALSEARKGVKKLSFRLGQRADEMEGIKVEAGVPEFF